MYRRPPGTIALTTLAALAALLAGACRHDIDLSSADAAQRDAQRDVSPADQGSESDAPKDGSADSATPNTCGATASRTFAGVRSFDVAAAPDGRVDLVLISSQTAGHWTYRGSSFEPALALTKANCSGDSLATGVRMASLGTHLVVAYATETLRAVRFTSTSPDVLCTGGSAMVSEATATATPEFSVVSAAAAAGMLHAFSASGTSDGLFHDRFDGSGALQNQRQLVDSVKHPRMFDATVDASGLVQLVYVSDGGSSNELSLRTYFNQKWKSPVIIAPHGASFSQTARLRVVTDGTLLHVFTLDGAAGSSGASGTLTHRSHTL